MMGRPSGRRTVPVRVFLSPAELEAWEALREHLRLVGPPPSRADWVMDHVVHDLESYCGHLSDRCHMALAAFDRDESRNRRTFQQLGGRPPSTRPAPRPSKEVMPPPDRTSSSSP